MVCSYFSPALVASRLFPETSTWQMPISRSCSVGPWSPRRAPPRHHRTPLARLPARPWLQAAARPSVQLWTRSPSRSRPGHGSNLRGRRTCGWRKLCHASRGTGCLAASSTMSVSCPRPAASARRLRYRHQAPFSNPLAAQEQHGTTNTA